MPRTQNSKHWLTQSTLQASYDLVIIILGNKFPYVVDINHLFYQHRQWPIAKQENI